MSNWLNSEIVLKFMGWIESIFSFFKSKHSSNKNKSNKKKLKEKLDEVRSASVNGDEDKINIIVDNIHKDRMIDEKIKKV